jgi:uncharacterized protein (UPF0276 family)
MQTNLPVLGVGIGYRPEIHDQIMEHRDSVDWLELITEHYIQTSPEQAAHATELRADFPLIPHGIEMSIGTEGDLDPDYVTAVAELVEAVQAPWFSDHLSFTQAGGVSLGQLTPVVRTRETAAAIGRKARAAQEAVGVPFLLENITYYVNIEAELTEAQFITEVLEHGDCGLLLDMTNVFINSVNHGFDPYEFLSQLPLERVVQIHLAGGEWQDDVMVDSHSHPVHEEVWQLLDHLVQRAPLKGILLERDDNFSSDFDELEGELERARAVLAERTRE